VKATVEPKKFVPFTLHIEVESLADLAHLYHRFNLPANMVRVGTAGDRVPYNYADVTSVFEALLPKIDGLF
jgi:hypothetical protein